MALFSLSDLTKPVTRAEVQANIFAVLGVLGISTTAWAEGDVVHTLIVSVSAVVAALSSLQANIAKSGFLDMSSGPWLEVVAKQVYNVDPIRATYASGECQLHNSGGGLYVQAVGECIVRNPTTGKSYRNAEAFTLNPGATLIAVFEAVEAGSASNAASDTITSMVSNLLSVSVTNTTVFTGLDAEPDPAIRGRSKMKLGSLSPMGPWDAYAYAARTAVRAGGEPAGVTRTRLLKDGYGNVTAVVGSASGTVGGTLGDLSTDLGAVDEAVQRNAAPFCVAAHTQSATALAVTVSYELWAYNTSGLDDAGLKLAVRAKLAEFFSSLAIGGATLTPGAPTGYVYVDALRAVISTAIPQTIHVVLTLPAADVALTATQVATLIHSVDAHAVVHQVSPSEGT